MFHFEEMKISRFFQFLKFLKSLMILGMLEYKNMQVRVSLMKLKETWGKKYIYLYIYIFKANKIKLRFFSDLKNEWLNQILISIYIYICI